MLAPVGLLPVSASPDSKSVARDVAVEVAVAVAVAVAVTLAMAIAVAMTVALAVAVAVAMAVAVAVTVVESRILQATGRGWEGAGEGDGDERRRGGTELRTAPVLPESDWITALVGLLYSALRPVQPHELSSFRFCLLN